MKKLILILCTISIFIALFFNLQIQASESNNIPQNTLRIHYKRLKADYNNFGVWLWYDTTWQSQEGWPKGLLFDKSDSYGVYVDVPLKNNAKKIGIAVVNTLTGVRDGGDKLFYSLDKYNEIWLKEGSDEVYISADLNKPIELINALIKDKDKILIRFTNIEGIDKKDIVIEDSYSNRIKILEFSPIDYKTIEIKLDINLLEKEYFIKYKDKKLKLALGPEVIDKLYYYNGNDLGANFINGNILFKVWAPLSEKVYVVIYDKNNQYKKIAKVSLSKSQNGLWQRLVKPSDLNLNTLDGYFYQYEIVNQGKSSLVLDPYTKSMAEFKNDKNDTVGKGAIIDLNKTIKVKNYANIKGYKNRKDAIIYEVHVRDFTVSPHIKTKAQFGTYKAFIEKLDYLKDLGVTHIQLLPVLSYYFGDESKRNIREMNYSVKNNNYNWGYDPHNYFSPEGMYSENPTDPYLRINELKSLINAIHQKGMGVILDVVYNHTAITDIFENILPGYYYRLNSDGNFTSASGCGNDLATTNKMVRKLIVDSVKYWVKEYKVDGFRFDLMGLIDTETIEMAYNEAAKLNPNILFLGEGWKMYNGPKGTKGADQDWMQYTNIVSVFSDSFRDLLKMGGFQEGVPAFLTGKPMNIKDIFTNIKGQATNFIADSPIDCVQYIEAHDGLTFHDTICVALNLDPIKDKKEIYQRIKLGNLILMSSQGVCFLHAGQEIGRTKEWKAEGLPPAENKEGTRFIKNSYDSSDIINCFDWSKLKDKDTKKLLEYTKGLIKLRKSTDAFRLGNKDLIEKNVKLIQSLNSSKEDLALGYSCKDSSGNIYYIFINADKKVREFSINLNISKIKVIVDNTLVNLNGIKKVNGVKILSDKVILEPLSGAVIKEIR